MKIKSYFADSVEQAIQEARQELGAEAMLITSRRSSPDSRSLGAYEVVFGLHGAMPAAAQAGSTPAAPRRTELSKDLTRDLSGELQHLRAQLQEIKSTLQGNRGSEFSSPDAEALLQELIAGDLSRDVAQDIVGNAVRLRDQLSRDQPKLSTPLRAYASELISNRLQFAPPLQKTDAEGGPVIAFVGPAGAGKTTTLIKIAIRDYLAQRQSVRIISVDPYRVAAHEKLRSFASIIGVAFTAVTSLADFLPAVEDARKKTAVLIDTPGYSPAEMDGAQEMARCFARLPKKQVHLVLPASMKRADLSKAVRSYSAFEPDCLLFTKLDETESQGAILSVALETGRPLSFFASGQNIPEDIETAQARVLLASMFRPELAEAVSAA
ncbi:MAG TPA: hypothetical protein VFW44_15935 [Bryobacteraceae bacterium]|nr:hypothetical protein [Bryobacteraceae bacterium]